MLDAGEPRSTFEGLFSVTMPSTPRVVEPDRSGQSADAFCTALTGRLVGSLLLFCGERDTAEDVAQEALARTMERWDRVRVMESPEAWTYRTAFNIARSQARRRLVERRAVHRLGMRRAAIVPDTAAAIAIREAVMALPPRQRAAIIARFYAGLSVDEASQVLNCAPGTVKSLVFKAVANLRNARLIDEPEGHNDAATE
jgi:RNA polymerase sigma factor (sigma-70 family)